MNRSHNRTCPSTSQSNSGPNRANLSTAAWGGGHHGSGLSYANMSREARKRIPYGVGRLIFSIAIVCNSSFAINLPDQYPKLHPKRIPTTKANTVPWLTEAVTLEDRRCCTFCVRCMPLIGEEGGELIIFFRACGSKQQDTPYHNGELDFRFVSYGTLFYILVSPVN